MDGVVNRMNDDGELYILGLANLVPKIVFRDENVYFKWFYYC